MVKFESVDILLVGGGLASGLIALCLKQLRPELSVRILERTSSLGGDHTWCMHGSDVDDGLDAPDNRWFLPLISKSWDTYDVHFPQFYRRLPGTYISVRSKDFATHCKSVIGEALLTNTTVRHLTSSHVVLGDGSKMHAALVLDARGFSAYDAKGHAYQKFVGCFVKTAHPHGLTRPVLMDARVAQTDGFRFVYTLPFADDVILVEDTRYSDTPDLDEVRLEAGILDYCQSMGITVETIIHREKGALPLPLTAARSPNQSLDPNTAMKIGVAGGLFNATTGYSLLEGIRFARWLATNFSPAPSFPSRVREYGLRVWDRNHFSRRLNTMLFNAAPSGRRVDVMARFYRHPPSLVERLYAGKLTPGDKLKILAIKPPVPIGKALSAFLLPQEVRP